jgi:hypothetical protein
LSCGFETDKCGLHAAKLAGTQLSHTQRKAIRITAH